MPLNKKISEMGTRPATHVLTTRIDGRYLATLARFWHEKGEHPRSSSELIRLSLEAFAELLTTNQMVEFVSTHSDAIEVLERLGIRTKTANQSNLARMLAAEDGEINFTSLTVACDPFAATKQRRKSEGLSSQDPSVLAAQAILEKHLSEDLTTRVADATNRSQEFKEALGVLPSKE